MPEKTTRRTYSAEELQRLRVSCSQPKLREAIEELDGEDADLVKEHVLRGSKSWAARSYRSRAFGNSLRVPSNKENRSTTDADNSRQSSSDQHSALSVPAAPALGEIAANGQILRPNAALRFRPSPTPSLKKKKAEAIVKAHGSPQHIRVTAGGRIVPSEQSPLCHPRYGYSAIKANGGLIKFAPNHPLGKSQWTQATQNGFVAQDFSGRLCQIVNGTILPLNEVDGALRLFVPAPNLNISSRGSSFGPPTHDRMASVGHQPRAPSQSKAAPATEPPLPAQTNALELEYSKLEHELKELDKTEALHGRTMAKTAKDALVGKRRELVVTLDNIRKAIKSIKSAPMPEAPLSPSKVEQRSMSPPRSRLPAFLQQREQHGVDLNPPFPPNFNQFFGLPHPAYSAAAYGSQTTPSPEAPFGQGYPLPALFVPPPPFDGSMGSYGTFAEQAAAGVPIVSQQADMHDAIAGDGLPEAGSQLPQHDGAHSIRELRQVASPKQSHAVDIKAPESRATTTLKSSLNPMSPAYKPGTGLLKVSGNTERPPLKPIKDRAPTPLSPLHQLRPPTTTDTTARKSDRTVSPIKKSPHLHSSSVSSFDTADFFPRNTREYSTRKFEYPETSEDKENVAPRDRTEGSTASPTTPAEVEAAMPSTKPTSSDSWQAPVVPHGSPATTDAGPDAARRSVQHTSGSLAASLPDRVTHNISPKSKRQDFLFVQEHPNQYTGVSSSSPETDHECRDELCVTSSPLGQIDFSNASREWIEGYRAGLARKAVPSTCHGEFLDGYCAGLLKSKPPPATTSTGSPSKPPIRRPSPALALSRPTARPQTEKQENAVRPSVETTLQSMDTLKEAVFAPQNEQAILSPTTEGPEVKDMAYHLGAWSKQRELMDGPSNGAIARGNDRHGFPFPHRTASMMERQGYTSEISFSKPMAAALGSSVASSTTTKSVGQCSTSESGNRVSSMTSIDSTLYRQVPGYRIFSAPLEWKSASSIAHAAGLAAGQITKSTSEDVDVTTAQARNFSIVSDPVMEHHGRFKEGSIDGVTNPPNSPQADSSPSKDSTTRDSSKKPRPSKGTSPAKVKFERIAERVGITVTAGKKEGDSAPNTPPGKRHWRNVWRGGVRKDVSKDDSTFVSTN